MDCWKESVRRGLSTGAGKRQEAFMRLLNKIGEQDSQATLAQSDDVEEDVDTLAQLPKFLVFAPAVGDRGIALPNNRFEGYECVIYLSPMLEFESKKHVEHTVAHEFAHACLRHHTDEAKAQYVSGVEHGKQKPEVDADALAATWGFPRSRRMAWSEKTALEYCRKLKSRSAQLRFAREQFGIE